MRLCVSRVDIVALAVVLAKRDVTSVTVPENEICNRPSIPPQLVLSITAQQITTSTD